MTSQMSHQDAEPRSGPGDAEERGKSGATNAAGRARRHWSRRRVRWAAAAGLALALTLGFGSTAWWRARGAAAPNVASAQAIGTPLTANAVAGAFRVAGLRTGDLRRDRVGGSPSGPPATEREAWSFAVPSVAPSGGRILVFDNETSLRQKEAWFRKAGVDVLVYRNVIVWLDPDMSPADAARFRLALESVR